MFKFPNPSLSKAVDGLYSLEFNLPILVNPTQNLAFKIYESATEETLIIKVQSSENDEVVLGHECASCSNDKRADFLCIYYLSSTNKASCFAYDLKKTVCNKKTVFGLVSQLQKTISYAEILLKEVGVNSIERRVGVITEKIDLDKLKKNSSDLELKNSDNLSSTRNISLVKYRTSVGNFAAQSKLLKKFCDGKIELNGQDISLEIRYFDDTKKYTLEFSGSSEVEVHPHCYSNV